MERPPPHTWRNTLIVPKNNTNTILDQIMQGYPFAVSATIPQVVLYFRANLYNFLMAKSEEMDLDHQLVCDLYEYDPDSLGPIPDEFRVWRTDYPSYVDE